MTTEFHQPTHPIRITRENEGSFFTHPVFAIAISNSHDVEYLTINGAFYNLGLILYAEQLVNGEWTKLKCIKRWKPEEPAT